MIDSDRRKQKERNTLSVFCLSLFFLSFCICILFVFFFFFLFDLYAIHKEIENYSRLSNGDKCGLNVMIKDRRWVTLIVLFERAHHAV